MSTLFYGEHYPDHKILNRCHDKVMDDKLPTVQRVKALRIINTSLNLINCPGDEKDLYRYINDV